MELNISEILNKIGEIGNLSINGWTAAALLVAGLIVYRVGRGIVRLALLPLKLADKLMPGVRTTALGSLMFVGGASITGTGLDIALPPGDRGAYMATITASTDVRKISSAQAALDRQQDRYPGALILGGLALAAVGGFTAIRGITNLPRYR